MLRKVIGSRPVLAWGRAFRFGAFCLGSALGGCAHPGSGNAAPPPALASPQVPPAPPGPRNHPPPLTPREVQLRSEVVRDTEQLASRIGERNVGHPWELAAAADYLAAELETAGYSVGRQGYQLDSTVVAQNLIAEVRGEPRGREIIVVGAHYDSRVGSPGADDNATGVAAVLALARRYRSEKVDRTLRFVLFAAGAAPYETPDLMGSTVYAREAASRGDAIVAMLSVESIGCYSRLNGSQARSADLATGLPEVGHFVAVIGDRSAQDLLRSVTGVLERKATIEAASVLLSSNTGVPFDGARWAFQQVGIPAVLLTDTCTLRNRRCGTSGDTVDQLDYASMARVVAGLEQVVQELAAEVPSTSSPPEPPRRFLSPTFGDEL